MRTTLRIALALAAIAGLGAALTSCFDTATQACRTGLVCPLGTVCSADGTTCIQSTATCGNGRVDGDEKCDDGNVVTEPPGTPGACRADCRGTASCGDGNLDSDLRDSAGKPLEACDDGNTGAGDGCNPLCQVERCGNATIDVLADGGTEPCDDGNTVQGDGCRSNCTREVCGDGLRDPLPDGGTEPCDDGNNAAGDDCSPACQLERCGNGIVDVLRDGGMEECDSDVGACGTTCLTVRCGNGQLDNATTGRGQGGEVCDDGNTDAGDGCHPRCIGRELCGDSLVDPVLMDGGSEVCDDGNRDGGDGCSADCRSAEVCGNGITDSLRGELCDDSNLVSGDGCRQDCKGLELCGDNFRDAVLRDGGSEQCDDGNPDAGDGCSPTCRFEICGNAIIDPGEICDDGNTNPIGLNDNCSSDCRSTGTCGNGTVEAALGEQCDNGVANSDTAACTSQCLLARCGDGLVRAGVEDCDTSGESASCNVNCTNRRCGDGVINATAGEQCDVPGVGQGTETATCDTDCTAAFCGDNKVNLVLSEQCDTGGNSGTCDSNCTPALCGDGFLNSATKPDGGVEQCDTAGSTAFCDNDCTPAACGDGFFNNLAGEQCDDGNGSNADDCVAGCRNNVCGDGFRDQQGAVTEACDDGNTVSETDCAYGLTSCTACNASCTAVLTPDTDVCGDGTLDAAEVCDDGNTTTEPACAYGTPTCNGCTGNCQAQFSLTGPVCGDGLVNGPVGDPELCDDGNATTEGSCPYGQPTCTVCGADCRTMPARTGIYCGDGTINGGEVCDDGNAVTESECAYGLGSCTACTANCGAEYSLTGPRCGDNVINGPTSNPEACDDGNTSTETSCPYGQPTCARCDTTCDTVLSLTGPYCGDGLVESGVEQCDDANASSCGTCNATCTVSQPALTASGTIRNVARDDLTSGETFTLNDGLNPPVTFVFVKTAMFDAGTNWPIDLTGVSSGTSTTEVATLMVAAINGYDAGVLEITATQASSHPRVRLSNDNVGGFGNRPITEAVAHSSFAVSGMAGGGGADCDAGVGCLSNNDCKSGLCNADGGCD